MLICEIGSVGLSASDSDVFELSRDACSIEGENVEGIVGAIGSYTIVSIEVAREDGGMKGWIGIERWVARASREAANELDLIRDGKGGGAVASAGRGVDSLGEEDNGPRDGKGEGIRERGCLLYTSPSPRDRG